MNYDKFIRRTVVMSTIVTSILFMIYGYFIQSDSIKQSLKSETSVMVDLIFQNLYTAMKSGYDKEQLDDLIVKIENTIPESSISIYRKSDEVKHEKMQEAFLTKQSVIYQNDRHIDFAMPIFFKNDCISCHSNSVEGDLAGVIQFEYPVMNLNISLKEILQMFFVLFAISIFVIFVIWYIFLKKYFVSPIKGLITQMMNITDHKDLHSKIEINSPIKEIKEIENVFNEQNKNLLISYKELENLSNTDILTKIYNRKKFDELSEIEINKVKRYKYNMCFLVLDLNKFKLINDNYGHDIGDEVLVVFSQVVLKIVRESDMLFRTGGDEFVMILPHTSSEEAKNVVEKIKNELKAHRLKDNDIEISVSIGIAQFGKDGASVKELIKFADEKMYEDKEKIG